MRAKMVKGLHCSSLPALCRPLFRGNPRKDDIEGISVLFRSAPGITSMELDDIIDEMKAVARSTFVLVIGDFVAVLEYADGILRRDRSAGIKKVHFECIPRFR